MGAMAGANDGSSPPEVIARLVTNASKKPPGPVENDVAAAYFDAALAMQKIDPDHTPPREAVAEDFNFFALEGTPVSLYSNGTYFLYTVPIQLTKAALKDPDNITVNSQGTVGFSPDAGGWEYDADKVKADGKVVATFCLVQEKGAWKVHNFYITNDPLAGRLMKNLIAMLDSDAKKP